MREVKIHLNEKTFTALCKYGFLTFMNGGKEELYISRSDMRKLANGESIEKTGNNTYEVFIYNIDFELIKEIIKRSPIYSDLYYEI